MRKHGAWLLGIVWAFLHLSAGAETSPPKDRYFLSGDGWIQLSNVKTGESARLQYRLPDGSYPPAVHRHINRLFNVPADSSEQISLRLISLLDYIEDVYRHPIEILSGYRSPEYNELLRANGRLAARTSLHIEGMAADIRMHQALSAQAFAMIKQLNCCGVGFYHDDSLHVDVGPARFWDEKTAKVRTNIAERNKQIMVRTEHDIYMPGETVVLRLARITDYPIGLSPKVTVVRAGQVLQEFMVTGVDNECVAVRTPAERTVAWTIPPTFRPVGQVFLRVQFCQKPFPEMPDQIESNPILLSATTE
ncbi:MAG: DUF882 domain-containing protein [Candidatus Binatia bacterium]|nr:DUF882 domain-containing protein [Candidatus Binatia bacterium]